MGYDLEKQYRQRQLERYTKMYDEGEIDDTEYFALLTKPSESQQRERLQRQQKNITSRSAGSRYHGK
jgi:hypothetical protein